MGKMIENFCSVIENPPLKITLVSRSPPLTSLRAAGMIQFGFGEEEMGTLIFSGRRRCRGYPGKRGAPSVALWKEEEEERAPPKFPFSFQSLLSRRGGRTDGAQQCGMGKERRFPTCKSRQPENVGELALLRVSYCDGETREGRERAIIW